MLVASLHSPLLTVQPCVCVCVCVQVTVEDEGELRTLVEAARMEKKEERVSSYRVIVAATRQSRASLDSSLSHYRSCENLLQHLRAVAEHSALTGEGPPSAIPGVGWT